MLEEVGRAVASSLDLNAVLPTVAARALEITHADAVLIYGYDAGNHQFSLAESIGIDKTAEGVHRAIDAVWRIERARINAGRADHDTPPRRHAGTSAARSRRRGRL